MKRARRYAVVVIALLVLMGVGLAVWLTWFPPWGPTLRLQEPNRVGSVSVPSEPSSLAWSADGSYLAAGTSGSSVGAPGTSEVFVVYAGKLTIATTLPITGAVEGLAFSPDGKWLAVAVKRSTLEAKAPGELVVFAIPEFTPKFRTDAIGPDNGFADIAWAPDSRSLHAIDAPAERGGEVQFRRWRVPGFTELPAIPIKPPQPAMDCRALALSPDKAVLAVAEQTALGHLQIRLFDLETGKQSSRITTSENVISPRLGFTVDGKSVGIIDQMGPKWWDPGTQLQVSPADPRFVVQPAGLSQLRSRYACSPDGRFQAQAYDRQRDFGDLGWDFRDKEFGAFIRLTEGPTKASTWRVGAGDAPPVAFSPDGATLAGTARLPNGWAIVLWAVPR